ncbi:MAG: tetrahydrofolate dehydrogenase/cyclohydrolase catalytic domain-containing protein, partial [Saprospiraceae bacterium]
MAAQILDGKVLSNQIKEEIRLEVDKIAKQGGKIPHLAAILVGDNPASQSYVRSKVRSCEKCGFRSTIIKEPIDISQDELLFIIQKLNEDKDIDGFIVQLPLPEHIDEEVV